MAANSTLVRNLPYRHLVEYLPLLGWEMTVLGDRWLVFAGSSDVDGNPLEIVLPQNPQVSDIAFHLTNAVTILADVTGDSPENVAQKVRLYDRDVLKMRNLETGDQDSITLQFASKQVFELKNLVGYGACSEHDPKPHFEAMLPVGHQATRRYRFGHTFSGSFGFTVESSPLERPTILRATQKSLMPDDVEEEEFFLAPFDRRVMERIVRGLLATQRATNMHDVIPLVEEYSGGFNSKMCRAVVDMSMDKTTLEYTVLWSPKIAPEVSIDEPIKLGVTSYQYLEEAAAILGEVEPNWVTVQGMVTRLQAHGDPMELSSSRAVIIKWTNREGGKIVNILVPLEKDDYVVADEAHMHWQTVEITGIAEKVGTQWRLREAHNLKILR
jgi:hypothetical protein